MNSQMTMQPLPDDFLRGYQMGNPATLGGVTEIRRNLARGDQVICFQGPTGMGKTRMFSYMTHCAVIKKNPVWIIVHRQELLKQAYNSLTAAGVYCGLISPIYTPDPYAMVQVASIGTLANRINKLKLPPIVIVDEFHHAVSPTWFKVLKHLISKGSRIIGFTATPNRLDGKGLGKSCGGLCDSLVLGPQPRELISEGYLAKPKLFCPTLATPDGLHSKFGDYRSEEVDALMDKPKIIGDAVKSYADICPNKPMITFVRSLKMAAHMEAEYRAAGYQASVIEGKMTDKERSGRLNGLGNGALHVLISCALIDEGVDVPIVKAIQLLDPTKSLPRFLQRTGRGGRMFPGKDGYFLLDHVCNTFFPNMKPNHGSPDWDREWTLEGDPGGKRAKKENEAQVGVKQCLKCYACHSPAPVCPVCGYVYEVSAREIEQAEGELQELDAKRMQEIEENRAKMFRRREEGQCRTLADFQALAKQRGYSQGWAFHRFKARQGRSEAPALNYG